MQKHTRMKIPRSRRRLPFSELLLALCAVLATCKTGCAQAHGDSLVQLPLPVLGHQGWSSENGLPQNSVHQIIQTHDGYIWVATEGGAARFNGMQFTVFNQESNPAFTSNDTCCLAEDRSGALWIGTADGLLQYAGGAFRRYTVADGLPSALVVALAPADDGFVLALTSGGLARYDGHKFTPLALSASAIGTGPNGGVWIATAAAIFSYSQGVLHDAHLSGLPAKPIEGLGSLRDGSLWARTRTALLLWDQGHFRTWHIGRGATLRNTRAVLSCGLSR